MKRSNILAAFYCMFMFAMISMLVGGVDIFDIVVVLKLGSVYLVGMFAKTYIWDERNNHFLTKTP